MKLTENEFDGFSHWNQGWQRDMRERAAKVCEAMGLHEAAKKIRELAVAGGAE